MRNFFLVLCLFFTSCVQEVEEQIVPPGDYSDFFSDAKAFCKKKKLNPKQFHLYPISLKRIILKYKKDYDGHHPTQKPVELPVTAMTKSSKEEDIVLDLFLGSGTTLISAEKANRVCYGMELDPKYIDVIITRWCDYTGNGSIKLNGIEIIWQENDNAQA